MCLLSECWQKETIASWMPFSNATGDPVGLLTTLPGSLFGANRLPWNLNKLMFVVRRAGGTPAPVSYSQGGLRFAGPPCKTRQQSITHDSSDARKG